MKTSICEANKIDRNETKDKTLISRTSPWCGRVSTSVLSNIKKIVYRYNNIEFKWLKFTQILCGIYILTVTFTYSGALGIFGGARDRKTALVVDSNNDVNTRNGIIEYNVNPVFDRNGDGATISRAIIASSTIQMLLLGLSRFSRYFMYPAIVCVFWTKLRATQAFIDKTPFRVFCIQDTHRLHVYCGWVIFIDSCLHAIFHLIRWSLQRNLKRLLFNHNSGITGSIVIISTFIIVIPMTILKKQLKFEIRKYAHYFFWTFCIAMSFHASCQAIPNGGFCAFIFPILIISYGLDALYVKSFMSERINTVNYKVMQSGVELTMPVSKRFQNGLISGGYGYIMLPWIDKNQWHAFSLYENPLDTSIRHMFIEKRGDWTTKLHRKIKSCSTTSRPVWLSGPFPSPYNNAINFDNMILVASGIGITPALSAIEAHGDSRRINLIWVVRDASMLVFFLENAKLDEKGLNLIFYTGKESLPDSTAKYHQHFNDGAQHIKIINGRPDLSYVIPNIIEFVDKGGINWEKALLMNKVNEDEEVGSPGTTCDDCFSDCYDVEDEEDEEEEWSRPLVPFTKNASRKTSIGDLSGGLEDTWRALSMPKVWKEKVGTRDYIKTSMAKDHLETWGLLFCGGRNKLLENLIRESKDLGIPLHQEAFDW